MELVVFTGVQGSGKSTFYKERFFATHLRISLDLVKTRNREDVLLHACLAVQQPVVIDNTNPTRAQRVRYSKLGIASGMRPILYAFEVTAAEAITRNATRSGSARVPDVAIYGTLAKFEPPAFDEGFVEIYDVRNAESGNGLVVVAREVRSEV